ncbi:hypothetical protein PV387_26840 [Streptomyces sp. ME02-6987-2C]|uniref:hypothetical protein n=1 Tax=unclassified Streptomyces TaxID=2593676 RepID=UPI000A721EAA|nr:MULTISPECIES: hypothetical protein [unclassified Streptomyces]MDX3369600.1 hypothetical protein [Streptomyces sp. ME02-6987-2C]MDX3427033.1 hypothetical protein [Streptomyces sp. ME02-6985-2c]
MSHRRASADRPLVHGQRHLSITASHQIDDEDQAAVDALTRPAFANGANWA